MRNNIIINLTIFIKWLAYLTFPHRLSLLDRCYFGDKEALEEFYRIIGEPLRYSMYDGENKELFEKAFGNILKDNREK